MRREGLLRICARHGCVLRREGKEHSLWENPQTGHAEAIPRHSQIANLLAQENLPKALDSRPAGLKEGGARITRAFESICLTGRNHGYSPDGIAPRDTVGQS